MASQKTTKRSRARRLPRSLKTFIGLIAVACFVGYQLSQTLPTNRPFSFETARRYAVERIIDGDTLLLTDGTRIRLIGVDTPETKHPNRPVEPLGPEATEFVKQHIQGQTISLQFDRERRDRYQRVLAYVYVGEWFLNEELIRAGFSRAETGYPYSNLMKKRFQKAEADARDNHTGIWALEQ